MKNNETALHYKDGTTILKHYDLISFLNNKDFQIFHEPFTKERWEFLKHPKDLKSDRHKNLVDDLKRASILEEGKKDCSNYQFIKKENPQILHTLTILTNKCNMNCGYCYAEANTDKSREANGEKWKKFFEKIHLGGKFASQNISFTGGEPTVHPDFPEILNSVSGKYKIDVSSNGLRINNKLLDSLSQCENLHSLNISMDSKFSEQDEFFRGKGTYKPRMNNIKRLYNEGIPLSVSVVVNKLNLSSLEETTRFFLNKFPGISIKYSPLTKMGKGLNVEENFFLDEEDPKHYIDSILKMREEFGSNIVTDPSTYEKPFNIGHWSGRCSHMKYDSEKNLDRDYNKNIVSERCNAAYGVVSLSPEGRLKPCLRPLSFYSSMLNKIGKENLMPYVLDLYSGEIGNLSFWNLVKKNAYNFDTSKICALEKILEDQNEKGY